MSAREPYSTFPVVKVLCGSNLYGVTTPTSDKDIKSVFTLEKVKALYGGIKESRLHTNGKEGAEREEYEEFYIRQFAKLLINGQTVVYDMIFAPEANILATSPAWEDLIANKEKIVSQSVLPFVYYARSQAIKYSLKGSRLKTLKEFVADLTDITDENSGWFDLLQAKYTGRDGVRLWADEKGEVSTPMIEVCGKSFGKTTALKNWLAPLQKLIVTYGDRAEEAMMNDGKDLKAMYHAVRIIDQCHELLQTGKVTFPRPNADFLKAIRAGKASYEEVARIIEDGSSQIPDLCVNSKLRLKPDEEWIDNWAWRHQMKRWSAY